jgi:DNA-binding NarL/FixJ family response regulator
MAKAKQKSAPLTPVESILGISPAQASELLATLTEREQQVAALMATGKKNRGIADELGISSKTLDIHRTNVKRKLAGKTAIDVARVVFAKRFGEHLK